MAIFSSHLLVFTRLSGPEQPREGSYLPLARIRALRGRASLALTSPRGRTASEPSSRDARAALRSLLSAREAQRVDNYLAREGIPGLAPRTTSPCSGRGRHGRGARNCARRSTADPIGRHPRSEGEAGARRGDPVIGFSFLWQQRRGPTASPTGDVLRAGKRDGISRVESGLKGQRWRRVSANLEARRHLFR